MPIEAFWTWFASNEALLRRAYDDGDEGLLDRLISPQVDQLAVGLNWEIGPYSLPDNAFVLSPSHRELIDFTRLAIGKAPAICGWQFHAGKPPKALTSLVIVAEGHEVCADDWHYRLTTYNDGEFVDIDVFYPINDAPPEGREDFFCEMFVECLLGELMRLERVGHIKPNATVGPPVERSTPIRYLGQHVNDVLRPLH